MGESDTRRWLLRSPSAEISNDNIPTLVLTQWARQGVLRPGYMLSTDGETWVPAETLPELGMAWYIRIPGAYTYGPVTREAAEAFVRQGYFPESAEILCDPGTDRISSELPMQPEVSRESFRQELEETRRRLVMLEKELRQKDRRIEELCAEAEARQGDIKVEGTPDIAVLTAENERLTMELAHMRGRAQEQIEAAAENDRVLRQRIQALSTALDAARTAAGDAPGGVTDAVLFEVLRREAELLSRSRDEEAKLDLQLKELMQRRRTLEDERLAELRRLIGESPDRMRDGARRSLGARSEVSQPVPAERLEARERASERTAALEEALAQARSRESALQRQLVVREGMEAQLQAKIQQAERRTLDALELDQKLHETMEALGRERAAREEEHRENAHVQAQLVRRIEELERLAVQAGVAAYPGADGLNDMPEEDGLPPEPPRGTFSWLRRR